MTDDNDIKTYIVEVHGSKELAPLAIDLFERFEAFWVPDSYIQKTRHGTFMLVVAVYSNEALKKVRSFSAVKAIHENLKYELC